MNHSSYVSRTRVAVMSVLLSASLCGCYLAGSVRGELSLLLAREPISRVIDRPGTSAELRDQLKKVRSIRDFATRELGLPDNGSYRSYADVGRPYVVWNVVVAPEFSVQPKEWCYPIVGCVSYRGYFAEQKARSFAAKMRRRGFDVTVGGVAAYSTLGHFDDPILNTMVAWDDVELAAIIFHELTHQLVYVADDASFDEALATTVEEEGVRRWLAAQGRTHDLAQRAVEVDRDRQVVALLRAASDRLREVYAVGGDPQGLRERKAAVIGELRESYAKARANWDGEAPFAAWFSGEINNARLASVATYYDCVPGFQRMLEASRGDLPEFYARVRALSKSDRTTRDAAVCPGGEPDRR